MSYNWADTGPPNPIESFKKKVLNPLPSVPLSIFHSSITVAKVIGRIYLV